MRQLLEIETVPIKIETKTTFGRFEPASDPSEKQSAYDGKLKTSSSYASTAPAAPVASSPTQTAGAVTSAPQVTRTNISDVYSSGQKTQISYDQARTYGNAPDAAAQRNSDVSQEYVSAGVKNQMISIASQKGVKPVQTTPMTSQSYVSSIGSQVQNNANTAVSEQMYEMDKANFETSVNLGNVALEYISGSVEFNVVQEPQVNFKYVGDPIYVPKSADPNYVEPEEA